MQILSCENAQVNMRTCRYGVNQLSTHANIYFGLNNGWHKSQNNIDIIEFRFFEI